MALKPIGAVFGTNASLETDGIWIDYGEYGKFKIARAGGKNQAFTNRMEREMRPYRAGIRMGTIDDGVIENISRRVFAETVVLDWEIADYDESGEVVPVPFSVDKCVELFSKYPDLFRDILQQSQQVVNFVEETRAHDGKP